MEVEMTEELVQIPNTFKLYKRRWFVLISYCMLSFAVAPTTTCFIAVSNILQYYYNVQPIAIHMLAGVFLAAVLIFNLPASYILHKFELAFTLNMAATLNLIGAVIRYFAYEQEYGYYLLMSSNALSAVSLAFYMFLPAKLASNWFGKHERGKAIGIGVGFDMLTVGIGFLHSTMIIPNNKDKEQIKSGLKAVYLHQLIAAISASIILLFVKSRPKIPSSEDKEKHSSDETNKVKFTTENLEDQAQTLVQKPILGVEPLLNLPTFWECIKYLLKHRSFLIIIQVSAITASLEITYEMILNDALIIIFPGKEKEIGILGFAAVVLGFLSNVVAGVIIDKTKAYKTVTYVIFLLSGLSLVTWMLLLELYRSFTLISIAFCSLIMITTSYYSVANILIVVITHPIDPGTSTMISMIAQSIYACIISIAASFILVEVRVLYVNIMALVTILIALLLSYFIKIDNKRHEDLMNIEIIDDGDDDDVVSMDSIKHN